MMPDGAARFGLYIVRGFLDPDVCREIVADMRASPEQPATVYGSSESGNVDERVRRSTRITPSQKTVELVMSRLSETRTEIEKHFQMSLSKCEEPQFLRYQEGDFFVAHQDGNTGLLRLEREQTRKVSAVIFLSRQSEAPQPETYSGGSLVFSGRGRKDFALPGETGTLVAFRAETTHEVTPITHGERLSIISWYG